MLGIHHYALFILSGILLNLTPGQDTLYILGSSLSAGRRAGIASAFGVTVGSLVHTVAAALGLSVVLAASPLAFTVVKLGGAAYLIYLGAKLLLARASRLDLTVEPQPRSTRAAFTQGVLTNVLNPKVALFFLAFLPQFIGPESPVKMLAFLVLGATFITTGTIWCLVLACAAGKLRTLFVRRPGLRTSMDRVIGALFVLLGARLAWSR